MVTNIALFSGSQGFTRHISAALGADVRIHAAHASVSRLPSTMRACEIVVIHANSQREHLHRILGLLEEEGIAVAVAVDVPDLSEMLELSAHQIRAYFNSYMADVHYQQMIAMVRAGQTWISPPLMVGALTLARNAAKDDGPQVLEAVLEGLTSREREIACDVASGKTNQEIATTRHIAERTVKSHLTHIFKKLGMRNRQALTLHLRGAGRGDVAPALSSSSRRTH
ncbi:MAG: DNA-binding NarL/FixJ family response regulator [Gammaproteobacteria bacterium]|jgi:DNA-binding NarL/FixJ family response regulator